MINFSNHRASLKIVFRYLISGGLGFFTNISIYILFLYSFKISYVPSSAIAFCGGLIISFCLQKFFTFKNYTNTGLHKQILMHVALMIFNLCSSTLLIIFFVEKLSFGKVASAVIVNFIIAIWSFLIYKGIVFIHKDSNA